MMGVLNAQKPPSISATLALDPPNFKEGEAVELSITAVSHASGPITILTYSTVFNVPLAQRLRGFGGNFHCVDLDTNTPLRLQTDACHMREPICHKLDDSDSQYFHTLHPGEAYKFSGPCVVPHRELVPGHRYRLSVSEEEEVEWWREGTKEEVLESPGHELPDRMLEPSGEPIILNHVEPIEFTAPLDWKNIGASVAWDIHAMVGARPKGTSSPPSVTATLSLETSNSSGVLEVELSISVVSCALTPITIWIWPTILNIKVVQNSDAFILTHLDTSTPIPTQEIFHAREDGMIHREDRYFHTLQPQQPYTFSVPFKNAFVRKLELKPGRYRLATSGREELKWWKEGTREEVVSPLGQKPSNELYEASGLPIHLTGIEPVEFTILDRSFDTPVCSPSPEKHVTSTDTNLPAYSSLRVPIKISSVQCQL